MSSRRAATICLAIAVAASGALLIALDSQLTFISDDWELLVGRQGWSAGEILDPLAEHPVIGGGLFFRACLALFGMGSALPYFIVTTALFATSAVLLFIYLRRRVDDWLALIAAVLILFLGASYENLFWVFAVNFYGATVAGLGMLLALDRGDRKGRTASPARC